MFTRLKINRFRRIATTRGLASQRVAAVRELVRLGDPEAIDLMAKLTKDDDSEVRRLAMNALCALRDPRAVVVVLTRAAAGWDLRSEHFVALGSHRGPALDVLLAATSDTRPVVRATAAQALAESGNPEFVPHMERLLGDPDVAVRCYAAKALLQLAGTQAAGALGVLIRRETHPGVLTTVTTNLVKLVEKDPCAPDAVIHVLAAVLRAEGLEEGHRIHATQVLGRTRNRRAADLLAGLLADPSKDVQDAAATALVALGDRRGFAPKVRELIDSTRRGMRSAAQSVADGLLAAGWQPKTAEESAALALAQGHPQFAVEAGPAGILVVADAYWYARYYQGGRIEPQGVHDWGGPMRSLRGPSEERIGLAHALVLPAAIRYLPEPLLRELAYLPDLIEEKVYPGDGAYEQHFKDGHGPATTEEVSYDCSDVRTKAQAEMERRGAIRLG